MSRHARVELTDPKSDRPGWLSVIVIALTALGLGVSTTQLWLGPRSGPSRLDATRPAAPTSDTAIADLPRSRAAMQQAATPTLAQRIDLDSGVASDADTRTTSAAIAVLPASPPRAISPRPAALAVAGVAPRLTRGRVAYVRCDGLESRSGHFPCPRDRALELSVWSALRGLEHCEQARSEQGTAEVRLELGQSASTLVQVRPGKIDSLDVQIVSDCVGEALSAARTTLRPERMVISFGFSVH